MNSEQFITLGILSLAVILFLTDRLRPDLIAMLTAVLLAGTGILSAAESFSGFSSGAVMIIISVFIIAEGLNRTGVSESMARVLLRWGGKKEGPLVALFMAAGGFLSLFINNIAAAAVLIPSAGKVSEKSNFPVSKLLIPLVFATLLGGMATLLTTVNIVVGTVFEHNGLTGFNLLDFLPVGLPMLAAGIIYMVFWGRFRLPARACVRTDDLCGGTDRLFGLYGMGELFFRARIPAGSFLVDRKICESSLREEFRLSLVAVERGGLRLHALGPDTVLHEGDVLTLKGRASEFAEMDREPRLEIQKNVCLTTADIETPEAVLVEVMLSPRSNLIGSTLRDVLFRAKYGMNVIAIWRQDQPIRRDVRKVKLEFGDALMGLVSPKKLSLLRSDPDLIVVTSHENEYTSSRKAPAAVLILCATLLSVIFLHLPISQILFAGAVVMLLSGLVSMEQAYRAVDWRVIFLVAGILPMALAMQKSGLADTMSGLLLSAVGNESPLAAVMILFLASALLTQAVSGAAVAAVMAPIAAAAALASCAPAHALGMAVALGSSMAFLTPLGHPVNLMVMGAGGYRFSDYRRVGTPLFIILTIVVLVVFSLRWNLI